MERAEIYRLRAVRIMSPDALRRVHLALWLDDPAGTDPFCVANRQAIRDELARRGVPICARVAMGGPDAPCAIRDGRAAWTRSLQMCRTCHRGGLFDD